MSALLLFLYQICATGALVLATPYVFWRLLAHRQEMVERLGRGSGTQVPCGLDARRYGGDSTAAHLDAAASAGEAAVSAGDAANDARRPLWLHAASLGELESLRAIWETPERAPAPPLLITVLSVSARRRAEAIAPPGSRIRFAPLDLWWVVSTFLRRERPRGLVLVETELWPATLAACHRGGIPVALVSGRLSRRKWRTTRLLAPMLRPLLRRFAAWAVQSPEDAARFAFLGASRVEVAGNLKYRRFGAPAPRPADDGRFVFVAGSVRVGEEAVLDAARHGGVLGVIAPRHLRDRAHWIEACAARGVRCVARSTIQIALSAGGGQGTPGAEAGLRAHLEAVLAADEKGDRPVLIIDLHGELGAWYAVADAAFVGGTLVPIGGHNLFEPARCGVPVAFGPHTGGVADAAAALLRAGGGTRVCDGAELTAWVAQLRSDPSLARRGAAGAAEAASALAEGAAKTLDLLQRFAWFAGPSSQAARRRGESAS